MIIQLHDGNIGANANYEIPDEKVQEFIQWLCINGQWKTYPDHLMQRAMKLRKYLIEHKTVAGEAAPVLEPEPAIARLSSAGRRAVAA